VTGTSHHEGVTVATILCRGRLLDDGALRLQYTTTAAESGGRLHEMRATYAADSPWAPAHLHPRQDEHFRVVEGRLRFRVEGRERTLLAGESLDIPSGMVHQVRNEGDERAVAIWQTRPALRTAEFLEALAVARQERDLEGLFALADEFGDVFVLADGRGR
jgi:mannose-6-phosphate isomerase-like protein (cupin superfamily)